jgi:hypothetical protein
MVPTKGDAGIITLRSCCATTGELKSEEEVKRK